MADALTELRVDRAAVEAFLRLIHCEGRPFNIRAIDPSVSREDGSKVRNYFFSDPARAAAGVAKLAGCDVYVQLNPITLDGLENGSNPQLDTGRPVSRGVNTAMVERRQWLYCDVDAVRPSGVCSTDAEKAEAWAVAENFWKTMVSVHDWPDPMVCDSGNGYYLLWPVDLEAETGLVREFLSWAASEFSTDGAKIDAAMHDAPRIFRVMGTVNWKKSSPGRPNRPTVLMYPGPDIVLSAEQFEEITGAVALEVMPEQAEDFGFNVEVWLDEFGIDHKPCQRWGSGWKWQLTVCPFCGNSDHNVVATQNAKGGPGFTCHHNSCNGTADTKKTWADFRMHHDSDYRDDVEAGKYDESEPEDDFRDDPELGNINAVTAVIQKSKNILTIIENLEGISVGPGLESIQPERSTEELIAAIANPGGIIQEIIDPILETAKKPQPAFAVASALAALSTLIGLSLTVDGAGNYANLYTLIVAPTAGGKGHLFRSIRKLFQDIGVEDQIMGMPFSESGMVKGMHGRGGTVLVNGGEFAQHYDAKKADPNFAQLVKLFLSQHTEAGQPLKVEYSDTKSNVVVPDPFITLFGEAQPTTLWRLLVAGKSQRNGFLSRLLCVPAVKGERRRTRRTPEFSEDLIQRCTELRENLPLESVTNIELIDEVHDQLLEIDTFQGELEDELYDNPLSVRHTFWARAVENIKRVAAIRAYADGSPIVGRESFEFARAFVELSVRTQIEGFMTSSTMPDDDVINYQDRIWEFVWGSNDDHTVTGTTLCRAFRDPVKRVEAKDQLLSCGDLERVAVKTKGRSRETFVAMPRITDKQREAARVESAKSLI